MPLSHHKECSSKIPCPAIGSSGGLDDTLDGDLFDAARIEIKSLRILEARNLD
jgi:hypothetical protein